VPALYYACQGTENELRVMPPMGVANVMPLDREAIAAMDADLRRITI
jgi:hypothetical protein